MPELAELPGIEHARIIPREEHSISRKDISPNALNVLSRLAAAGFYGFLVGGGVRDLLLGEKPKDFDVATNALPKKFGNYFVMQELSVAVSELCMYAMAGNSSKLPLLEERQRSNSL